MIQVPLSRVSRHLGLCFGVHRREHGGLDLRCNLACFVVQESRRFLLLLHLLWVCGQRVCVVQAKRHIHSPRRRLDFVDAGAPHQYFRRMFPQSGRRLGVVTIAGPMFRLPEERMLRSSLMEPQRKSPKPAVPRRRCSGSSRPDPRRVPCRSGGLRFSASGPPRSASFRRLAEAVRQFAQARTDGGRPVICRGRRRRRW